MNSIKDVFNNFMDNRITKERFYSVPGTVQSVNAGAKVCTVKLVTDEVVEEVRLETDLTVGSSGNVGQSTPSGFVLVPAQGSQVLVTFLNRSDAFVSMFSVIENVYIKSNLCTFNDGNKGGLINIEDQVSKLNGLINELSAELVKIQTGITGAGGAYTPGNLSQFNKADFEDETIKH